MELKLLNSRELTELYQGELVHVFPHSELKPLKGMLRLMDMGRYEPLLAVENGEAMGYALMWLSREKGSALLEFLGALRGKRNQGVGSRLLTLLGERYTHLFGEVEALDAADPAENELRRHRVDFYRRNGFRVLGYECALFGVHFNCIYRGPETDDGQVQALHRGVYADYFSPGHMARYIQLPLVPGEAIKSAPEWVEE